MVKRKITQQKLGGSYYAVGKLNPNLKANNLERHHLIANSAVKGILSIDKGPAILMNKNDHRLTASHGAWREASAYRNQQRQAVLNGNPKKAINMEVRSLREKFGRTYNPHILQALKYWRQNQLEPQVRQQVAQMKQNIAQQIKTPKPIASTVKAPAKANARPAKPKSSPQLRPRGPSL